MNLRKIRRMMSAKNLFCRDYTDISDSDLDNVVREILENDKGLGKCH